MVGFQTKLVWRTGARFSDDTWSGRAKFARLGGLHRNTFVNSPRLSIASCAPKMPRLRFTGPITGVEGYVGLPLLAVWRGVWRQLKFWDKAGRPHLRQLPMAHCLAILPAGQWPIAFSP